MGVFDDIGDFFGNISKRELTQVEKIQDIEDTVRECARDLALTRDEIYIESLKENTIIMVRTGEEHIKKFASDGNMYVSLPETLYEETEGMGDFDKYHHIMDTLKLSLSAKEFRETDEEGETNFIEAEIIDNASKKYEETTGMELPVDHLVEYDDFNQPISTTKEVFEPKRYAAVKSDGESEEDEDDKAASEAKSSCEAGEGTAAPDSGPISMQQVNDEVIEEQQELKMEAEKHDYKSAYTSQSITENDQKTKTQIEGSTFSVNRYGDGHGFFDPKTKVELIKMANDIAKSLRGYNGKVKRISPAKRLSSKDICNDISDKIYIGKDYVNGKFIDQNIVVDCSGSMGGQPIRDAIKLCFIFNRLAQEELLEGCIILTETSENMHIEMPVHDSVIESLGGTGGGEGLTKTLNKFKDKIRNKNVIVMTDGDLVEEPIPDKFWEKGRMSCIGMYVNEEVKFEDLPGYDKGMSRWFPKTIIRNSFSEAVQKLIQLGLRASKR